MPLLTLLFCCSLYLQAQQDVVLKKMLETSYNLVPKHSGATQYFEMESALQKFQTE